MTILLIEDDAIEILKFNRSLIKLREVHELLFTLPSKMTFRKLFFSFKTKGL